MNSTRSKLILLVVLLFLPFPLLADGTTSANWPQWRGPDANGTAPGGDPPVVWSEDRNVRFKLAVPGVGHSTPIVWGDRLFLTTAIPFGEPGAADQEHETHDEGAHDNAPSLYEQKFVVAAIDRHEGTLLWQRTVRTERPHEGTHVTGSWASNSAVTDGERVFAFFGSRGLYALDMDGKVLWERDFGEMHPLHGHGEGASPALFGDSLVVNWDHEGDSFVVALDKRTGKELWRTPRDEVTSWSTPLVVEGGGRTQVVLSATNRVRGYDLKTGEEIWQCAGLSRNVVASPVAFDGLLIAGSSYDFQAMLAIRLSAAKGDVTGSSEAIAWRRGRDTSYVPSPLLYDGRLYFLKHIQGFITSVDARTGETVFGPKRLSGLGYAFASPVGAAGRVYVVGRSGATVVLRHGDEFEVLATNRLDDVFSASPVVVGKELYLRGQRYLYCLADEDRPDRLIPDLPPGDPGPSPQTPLPEGEGLRGDLAPLSLWERGRG